MKGLISGKSPRYLETKKPPKNKVAVVRKFEFKCGFTLYTHAHASVSKVAVQYHMFKAHLSFYPPTCSHEHEIFSIREMILYKTCMLSTYPSVQVSRCTDMYVCMDASGYRHSSFIFCIYASKPYKGTC